MRGLFSIIIFSGLIPFFIACNYNEIKDPNAFGNKGNSQSSKMSGNALVGWKLIQNTVMSNCLDCHSAGMKLPDLSSMSAFKQQINKVQTSVNQNKMPPTKEGYASLGDCEKSILDFWVRQGMPEISTTKVSELVACKDMSIGDNKPPEPALEDSPLNYQTVYNRILRPNCVKCHNVDDESDAAELLFYPYSAIQNEARLWQGPGESSKLIRSVTRTDENRMPPIDKSPGLSESEVRFLIRWIDAGTPE